MRLVTKVIRRMCASAAFNLNPLRYFQMSMTVNRNRRSADRLGGGTLEKHFQPIGGNYQ